MLMSSNFEQWICEYQIPGMPIIHAGAHFAEERDQYVGNNFGPVYWIEALPGVAEVCASNLVDYQDQYILTATLSDSIGERIKFYIAGVEDSSSSLLVPHLIEASHPDVTVSREIELTTTTLDELYKDSNLGDFPNYGLVMDLQGAELKALQGAKSILPKISFIISEVSTRELYRESVSFKEMTRVLDDLNFTLHASEMNLATGWGEALYINRKGNCSDILSTTNKLEVVNGSFSIGTFVRSVLVKLGAPHVVINKFRRK
jgi:FkbM family methyltransferase